MAVNANALITVAEARINLNLPYSDGTFVLPTVPDASDTSLDARLEMMINSVSDIIERYTRAFFVQTAVTEYLDYDGGVYIQLSNYPVADVTISVDSNRVFGAETALAASDIHVDAETGEVSIADTVALPANPAQAIIKAVYKAGYTTVPSSVKQACINVVGALYNQTDKMQFNQKKVVFNNSSTVEFYDNFDPLTKTILESYRRITL